MRCQEEGVCVQFFLLNQSYFLAHILSLNFHPCNYLCISITMRIDAHVFLAVIWSQDFNLRTLTTILGHFRVQDGFFT